MQREETNAPTDISVVLQDFQELLDEFLEALRQYPPLELAPRLADLALFGRMNELAPTICGWLGGCDRPGEGKRFQARIERILNHPFLTEPSYPSVNLLLDADKPIAELEDGRSLVDYTLFLSGVIQGWRERILTPSLSEKRLDDSRRSDPGTESAARERVAFEEARKLLRPFIERPDFRSFIHGQVEQWEKWHERHTDEIYDAEAWLESSDRSLKNLETQDTRASEEAETEDYTFDPLSHEKFCVEAYTDLRNGLLQDPEYLLVADRDPICFAPFTRAAIVALFWCDQNRSTLLVPSNDFLNPDGPFLEMLRKQWQHRNPARFAEIGPLCESVIEDFERFQDSRPANSGPDPSAPFEVVEELSQIRMEGEVFSVRPEAARMAKLLLDDIGEWIPMSKRGFSKPSDVKKSLPDPVRALIETDQGKGYRLQPRR